MGLYLIRVLMSYFLDDILVLHFMFYLQDIFILFIYINVIVILCISFHSFMRSYVDNGCAPLISRVEFLIIFLFVAISH